MSGGIREDRELRLWLAVRVDLGMSVGKIAAQAMHAAFGLHDYLIDRKPEVLRAYEDGAHTKICVKVNSLADLERVEREAEIANIPCHVVSDAGRSEIDPGTKTVCLFGPAYRDELPPFLRRLQVMKGESLEGSGRTLADATPKALRTSDGGKDA